MFKWIKKLWDCTYFEKMVGAISSGYLFVDKNCDGTYNLKVHDDDLDMNFYIEKNLKTFEEAIEIANNTDYWLKGEK